VTIAAGILAQAPTVYWKLDDPTGPAAADSSGNGHPGFFLSGDALHADGPEPGTFAISSSAKNAGVQIVGANPLVGTGPWTFHCWIACGTTSDGDNVLLYTGLSNLDGAGVLIGVANQLRIIRGNLEIVNAGGVLNPGSWHQVVHTFTPSGNRFLYVDGVQVDVHAAGVPNTVASTDPLLAQTPMPALLAHAAFWASALSGAQIAAMFAAGPGTGVVGNIQQSGVPVNLSQTSQTVDLAALLAFVSKTYVNSP
jgi:Concanavalin A-like lectin/glucanases superfamily